MAYYNINNFDNTINNDSENFKYLRPLPKQWNYRGTFKGFIHKQQDINQNIITTLPIDIRYKSMPLLYQYQKDFKHLWDGFEKNSLITNRGCLKQLATMNVPKGVKVCTFKLYKARNFESGAIMDNYILELGNVVDEKVLEKYQDNYFNGACAAGMLTKTGKCSPEYNTYKMSAFKLDFNKFSRTTSCPININSINDEPYFIQSKKSIKVYYTSEIDAFIKESHGNKTKLIPVEIKSNANNNMEIPPLTAFKTALQCQLAGINEAIFGFHDGVRIVNVKRYSVQQLKEIATSNEAYKELYNVDKAILEANFLLKEIINKFDENVCNGSMDIGDTLKIVKRLETEEHREMQKYCLDYYINKMPFHGPQKDVIPLRRKTCEF